MKVDTETEAADRTFGFIAMVAMLMSLTALSIDAVLPAFDYIRVDISMSNPNHAQLVIGFLFAGLAVGQLISGPLSDAFGRKPVLLMGLAIYVVGTCLCYFAQDLDTLLLGRFIEGIGVSGPYISAVAIVRDRFAGRQMAKVLSLVMMIFILVPAIAPSVGQAILILADWRGIFVFYLFYAFVMLCVILFYFKETLPPEKRNPLSFASVGGAFKKVVTNRITISHAIAMGLVFGSFIGYLSSSQQIFQGIFDTGKMFNVYFGCLALVLGVSSKVNSLIVGRLGMRLICQRALSTIIVASSLFLLFQWWGSISLLGLMVYLSSIFFCFGMVYGNLSAIAMEPMGKIAGVATAIIGSLSSCISMALGALIGQLFDNTLQPLTISLIIVPLAALGLITFSYRSSAATPDVVES